MSMSFMLENFLNNQAESQAKILIDNNKSFHGISKEYLNPTSPLD